MAKLIRSHGSNAFGKSKASTPPETENARNARH